jgi:hypothetical protein
MQQAYSAHVATASQRRTSLRRVQLQLPSLPPTDGSDHADAASCASAKLLPFHPPPAGRGAPLLRSQSAKAGEVATLQRTVAELRSTIDRVSAQAAGLEAGAAQQHGELATLRRLAQQVTDTEAAFAALAPSLALSTGTMAAAAAGSSAGGPGGGTDGTGASSPRGEGSAAGDASVKAASHAARLGRQASAVVEAAVAWLEGSPLSDGAPGLAAAIRRLLSLLRTAGVALVEVGGVVGGDARDKRQQRHALYDEIHALKQEVSPDWQPRVGRERPAVTLDDLQVPAPPSAACRSRRRLVATRD